MCFSFVKAVDTLQARKDTLLEHRSIMGDMEAALDQEEQKMSVPDDVCREYEMAHVGFLEELQALFSILFENPIVLGFYMFLFLFLMFLELLVVTSKGGDTRCDYELIVEHQLNIKKRTLLETEKRLLNQ